MGGNDGEMADLANWQGGLLEHVSKSKKKGWQDVKRRETIK